MAADDLYERYKDAVFEMSLNVQVRRGDPVRLRQWEAVESQRELTGLTDAEIARELGLAEGEVTTIRTRVEKDRYRFDIHQLIYKLKGSRKQALAGDSPAGAAEVPSRSSAFSRGRSVADVISTEARRHPDGVVFDGPGRRLSFLDFDRLSTQVAGGLVSRGVSAGRLVVYQGADFTDYALTFAAAARLGALFAADRTGWPDAACVVFTEGQNVSIAGGASLTPAVTISELAVSRPAPDESDPDLPFLLLASGGQGDADPFVHSQDSVLANAWFGSTAQDAPPTPARPSTPGDPLAGHLVALLIQGRSAEEAESCWFEPEALAIACGTCVQEPFAPVAGVQLRIEDGRVAYRSPFRAQFQWRAGRAVVRPFNRQEWVLTPRTGSLTPEMLLGLDP